jgi:hypothetical protein
MMSATRAAGLAIAAAITVLAAAIAAAMWPRGGEGLCGGRRYAVETAPNGASPYIRLSADGVSGPFLVDYGATASSLSASALPGSSGSVRIADFSLPGFKSGSFELRRYGLPLRPKGGQLGILGVDFLSLLSVEFSEGAAFVGAEPCRPDALRGRGLVPIDQSGFFSSNAARIGRKHPNVPVVFLGLGNIHTWAQIDTGYDDVLYPHSVDINAPLFQRLIDSGAALDHLANISVATCEGGESRQVFTVKDRSLVIETDQAKPIAQLDAFYLILKPPNGCGGIAAMSDPAAQLGASFLKIFGAIVFDPKGETVWLKGDGKERQPDTPPGAR